jgi:glucosyl-3-phosphoglycerate synthase
MWPALFAGAGNPLVMEYVQERVATLHDFGGAEPAAPTDRTAVVVPMTGREHASLAAERVLSTLARVDPARVVVALRADADAVAEVADWLDGFDLTLELLWCTAPDVEQVLADAGLDGARGKGRDVWLGLGAALDAEYVVVHDADATSYDRTHVPRLAFPLAAGYEFVKGYYARVENGRLYGRLCRLLFLPLLEALGERHDAPLLDYLRAFRYPLAGEFAATADVARRLPAQRGWGLEVGTLGAAFDLAGFDGSAQVDLGVHEHDHRSVGGPQGLGDMSSEVTAALFRALADAGIEPDVDALRGDYRRTADRLVDQYAADAAFNDLQYDRAAEREQVRTYAEAIEPPGPDTRLPAWADAPVDPAAVRAASREALAAATER